MSPQFVDFDGDKQLDIVAGTFSGSPFVAIGSEKGWQQPVEIKDGKGDRIVLNQFWNYETKKWDETKRCDPEDALKQGHGTSAIAWDQDGDGDLDLLLGDYDGGYLYLRKNDGKPGAPKFVGRNKPVMVGGKPLNVGKMSTPRIVDWDRDGLMDLVCSSMGDAYGDGDGGGVWLFLNTGSQKTPFAKAQLLIPLSKKESKQEPLRPDSGLYADVADCDGDGDLDLVVGGYTHMPKKGNAENEDTRTSCVWLYENKTSKKGPTTGAAKIR
ncbi:MAG TPA: FG-GAP-like repeat-containing protein [Planctomycetota bacterium]